MADLKPKITIIIVNVNVLNTSIKTQNGRVD